MAQELEIVKVEGVRGYIDANGTVQLNVGDIGFGLGFVQRQIKNGKEYTSLRMETINRYLAEFDFPSEVGKDDYIPENMFYRLAMKANNEAAKDFQAKVADKILPSIRKTGVYMTTEAAEEILFNPDFIIGLAKQVKDARAERDAALAQVAVLSTQVADLKPKADYCALILQSAEALPVTVIAKDYGMAAADFNALLHKLKIQYKVGKTWVLYQLYAGLGYMKSITKVLSDTLSVTYNYWTQKGRMFLYSMLKKCGILPLIERDDPQISLM